MTDTLTAERIEYIRKWAASGNGPRCAALDQSEASGVQGILPRWAWEMLDEHEDTFCQISPAGLTIASQAERVRELEAVRARLLVRALRLRAEKHVAWGTRHHILMFRQSLDAADAIEAKYLEKS